MLPLLVSDLRQYTYCARIVYYRYCLPAIRPVTYNMEAGKVAHEEEAGRERRRSLRAYGLQTGERDFDVMLASEGWGLRGQVDMVIRRPEEVIPIEYKNSSGRAGRHVLLQLAAYGILLEEAHALPAPRGFVYHIQARRAHEVALAADLRAAVQKTLAEIRSMIAAERMPRPPRQRAKCEICEFHRFCNDVI